MSLNVIAYQVKRDRPARRGVKPIPAGSTVHLITTARRKLYYHFCYTSRETAQKVANTLAADLSDTTLQFNFKADPEAALHTDLLL